MEMPYSGHRRALSSCILMLAVTLLPALAASVTAQVVNDPRIAEFDPSPDHWQTLESGEPAVVRYVLGMYSLGAPAPFATVDMGKPSPGADGKIRFDFSSRVAGWPLAGGSYEARVSAVGPDGSGLSDPSNPFTFSGASSCAISLSPTSLSVPASGASYTIQASTAAGCSWTAATSLSWVKMWTSGGSGSGPVPFAVQSNPTTSSRSGTVTIGGRAVTIRQAGLSTSPTTYQLTVTRPAGGTVYSAGIRCGTAGTTCAVTMPAPMTLGLDAAPDAGYALSGWTGDCRGTTLNFTLQLNGVKSCGAIFSALPASPPATAPPTGGSTSPPPGSGSPPTGPPFTLTVARPTGGTVYSAGIRCGTAGATCAVTMPGSMTIGLDAAPDAGYALSGWTGDCSGTTLNVALQLNGVKSCGAIFRTLPASPPATAPPTGGSTSPPPDDGSPPIGPPYTLTVARPSGGVVKAAGIACGTGATTCAVTMPGPMTIGFEATADAGYVFLGWTGHCTGSNSSQVLALEGPRTCGATFTAAR